MTDYPDSIYTPRDKENRSGVSYDPDKKTVIFAEDVKKLDDEVVAVETELGTNPKGAYASVKAWLEWLTGKVKDYLDDLLDVEITNPANNEGLLYDQPNQKWKNKPVKIPHIFRTGRFYFPSRITVGWGADPAIAFPTGFAYAYPMYLPNSKTFNLLRCEVTAAVTGAACKFALYANNNGVPGSLIATLGEVSCGTIGIKDITINVTVEGLVFWVFTVSSGSVGFRAVDSGYSFDYYGSADITYRGANCFRGNQYYLDPFVNPFSLNVPSNWQIPFCLRAA